jgi:hypothetical protein
MSVKDFFAYSCIKPLVLEFLKNKADFENLHPKYKKPFRGHVFQDREGTYVSDGFNQIFCSYSEECKEKFKQFYPPSVFINDLNDMLVCVEKYSLKLATPFMDKANMDDGHWKSTQLKLILEI